MPIAEVALSIATIVILLAGLVNEPSIAYVLMLHSYSADNVTPTTLTLVVLH